MLARRGCIRPPSMAGAGLLSNALARRTFELILPAFLRYLLSCSVCQTACAAPQRFKVTPPDPHPVLRQPHWV
jgi:hypothetical protein